MDVIARQPDGPARLQDTGQCGRPRLSRSSAGRHPSDPRNLWPEPRYGEWSADRKDELAGFVNREVCVGRMSLQEGQAIFLGDWIAAYRRYHPAHQAGE